MTVRPGPGALDTLAGLGTATIGEVAPGPLRLLDGGLRPVTPLVPPVAGVALTVRCRPGDNLALHLALSSARPGDLLVVDYGSDRTSGPFGEIMATAAMRAGIRGLVIDGAIRDSMQIAKMGFGTWCRGTAIPGTRKDDRGAIGVPCIVGGVEIRPGDIVVADADAILALDPDDLPAILDAGRIRQEREARALSRIEAGETTCDIFGLY